MPRSKPSITTYIITPKTMMTAQMQRKVDAHGVVSLSRRAGSAAGQRPHRALMRVSPGPPDRLVASAAAGPAPISRSMYTMPAPNTTK